MHLKTQVKHSTNGKNLIKKINITLFEQ